MLGGEIDLKWFHEALSRHMIVKMRGIMNLGFNRPSAGDCIREIRFLNWIVTIGFDESCGLPYLDWEADPRHCMILWQQLGLLKSKAVSTPGVKRTAMELSSSPKLDPTMARKFRSACMRAMYLSHDRPDIANACKEAARHMKEPLQVSMEMVKRIGRYLRSAPRLVRRFY